MNLPQIGSALQPRFPAQTSAATPQAPQGPRDVVETSEAKPVGVGIAAATSLAMSVPLAMAGTPVDAHRDNLLALEALSRKGFKFTRRRRFRIPLIMKKIVDVRHRVQGLH
ncbi:MAG: hypothetical protein FJX76_02740 [Armatimonadetes bacterium]|nr:hypothetical protein [Armatimonadota bacterium]